GATPGRGRRVEGHGRLQERAAHGETAEGARREGDDDSHQGRVDRDSRHYRRRGEVSALAGGGPVRHSFSDLSALLPVAIPPPVGGDQLTIRPAGPTMGGILG